MQFIIVQPIKIIIKKDVRFRANLTVKGKSLNEFKCNILLSCWSTVYFSILLKDAKTCL